MAGHSQHDDDEHHVHIYHDSISDHPDGDSYPEHQSHHDEQHVVHVYHNENDLHDGNQHPHSLHKPHEPNQHPNSPSNVYSSDSTQHQHASHQEPIGHNYIIHEQHSTPPEYAPEHYIAYEQRDARHNVPKEHYHISQSQHPTSHDSYSQPPIHRHTDHIHQHTSPHGKQHQYEMFDTASRKRKRHAVDDGWQSNSVSKGDKLIAGVSIPQR